MAYSKEYWGEDGLGPVSDDVALRNSQQRGYANSDQSLQDQAYAEHLAALEAEKKKQAAAAEAAAMQNAVAQDAAAAKVAAAPVVALPKANARNNEQQDRNSLGRQYLLKSLALGGERPDMAAMNEYAQQRGRQGSSAMLNSLLANSAGENFAPQQAAYLKQAMAARDPLEVSGGMLTNKGFVEDPYAARERERESNYKVGKELLDQETKAKDRRAARNPYYTIFNTPNGARAFNSATGQTEPIKDSEGNTISDWRTDPNFQEQISESKQTGKNDADRRKAAQSQLTKTNQLLGTLNTAEKLLNTDPTHSGVGNSLDKTGQIIGYAPTSAVTAQELEVLGGWLTSNVPRMEGPQSDKDTAQYKLMAGSVGDRTLPIKTRLGAIKVLKDLQEKYKDSQLDIAGNKNTSPSTSRASNAPPAVQEFGAPPPGAVRRVVK